MKKISLKVLSAFALGILSIGTMMGQGFSTQNTSFNPSVPGSTALTGQKLIDVIKSFINRMLGMLALIALVILLRGGFQMVTAAGDDAKYKKGFKILSQAAVGLVFIGVSWLIVSVIFRLLGVVGVS